MKIWTNIAWTHVIVGLRQGRRNRSVSVFFTRHGWQWIHADARHANDIHAFGPFRFSDTVD